MLYYNFGLSFINGLFLLILIFSVYSCDLLGDTCSSEIFLDNELGFGASTVLYSNVLLYGYNGLYESPELKNIVSFSAAAVSFFVWWIEILLQLSLGGKFYKKKYCIY